MNVLHLIPSMNPSSGGPCEVIRNLIPELNKLGIHNEVASLDDPIAEFEIKDQFPITALGPAKGPWYYSNKIIPWLNNHLESFDVVIVHALWLYHGYALKKSINRFKKLNSKFEKKFKFPKVFIMPHGMLDPYFQQSPQRKFKALRNWAYWKLIESKLVNNADGLLFTCSTELLLAREPFKPYYPRQEINIGLGIESPPPFNTEMTSDFLKKCPQVQDSPYFLFLGRIHEKKGIDLLIHAYAKVLNTLSDRKKLKAEKLSLPKLVIAGPGLETNYGKKMRLLASGSKSLQESVFFTDILRGNAKWGAFYNSEAFVLPSHQENFGIAVVEALACGKPVLISKQVNIWKEISSLNAGIVHDDNLDGAINLLNDFLSLTEEEKDKMGQQARLAYKIHFDISIIARRLSDTITN